MAEAYFPAETNRMGPWAAVIALGGTLVFLVGLIAAILKMPRPLLDHGALARSEFKCATNIYDWTRADGGCCVKSSTASIDPRQAREDNSDCTGSFSGAMQLGRVHLFGYTAAMTIP